MESENFGDFLGCLVMGMPMFKKWLARKPNANYPNHQVRRVLPDPALCFWLSGDDAVCSRTGGLELEYSFEYRVTAAGSASREPARKQYDHPTSAVAPTLGPE
ncbi:MAG: hypothetical protein AAGI63_12360 [Planctomycetota bacterium]